MSIRRALLATSTALAAALASQAASAQARAAQEIEELVVTGIRASQAASIETKREAQAMVDVITAQDVGKFPDKNVAEALQRVPGVQINREFGEGERVSLRGLAPNLTRTLLNGHALATADWFILDQLASTRSFNYLMLPSEIIGQVQVYKSPTAEIEEGGVGGTIDVITRHPLALAPFYAAGSIQAAYTENNEKADPQGSALLSWKNADSTLGVMVAGIYQKRRLRRDGVEVLGYFDSDPGPGVRDTPSLIGSALFRQKRVRKGGNFEIQYQPNDQFEARLTGLYSKFDADNFNENFLAWGSNAIGGGGTLTNAPIVGQTAVAGRIASTPGGTGLVYDAIDRLAGAETRNLDLDLTWRPAEGWKLHAQVGYTDAEGNTNAQPFIEFGAPATFDYDLRGRAPQVTFTNVDPTNPAQTRLDFASLHKITNDDEETYGFLDAEKEMAWGPLSAIRFGVKATDHDRATNFLATTGATFATPLFAAGCGGPCTPGSFFGGLTPSDYLQDIASPRTLRRYFEVDKKKLETIFFSQSATVRARVPLYSEIFDVGEKTLGAYLLGDFKGEGWRGNIGVRVVRTKQTSGGYAVDLAVGNNPGSEVSNAFGAFERVSISRDYTDILPSANFNFDLRDDLVLRFAAARTVARPDFTDVAPRVSLNPGALSGTAGNPNIDPYRANQFDVSVEWYPAKDSIAAVAFYYKDIESFITDRPITQTFAIDTTTPNLSRCTRAAGTNPNLFNCVFDINQRSNGGGGRVKGLEANVQVPLKWGFGVQTNYTYSNAKANSGDPIPGNSKHTFNLVGYYETEKLSARLAYTYRTKFFITFDRASPINQAGLESLDASVSYNLTDNITLTAEAVNLTDENIVQYSGDRSRPRGIYDNGRQLYGGLRFKF